MIIFTYIILLGIIRITICSKKNNNKGFVLLAGVTLFLISALRSINFGSDTIGYVSKYISLSYTSIHELLMNVINQTGKDPFFYLFSKIINLMGASYQIWIAIIAGIFCYSISKLINKYSVDSYISFVSFISLGYFYFSLTGLRQTMALSMIIFSYKYLRDKKIIPFIILVVLGSMFHSTAIVFLVSYPLSDMKVGWKQIVGASMALIMAYFFKGNVISILSYIMIEDQYEGYLQNGTTLTITGFLIQLFIYLFCLLFKDNILKDDTKNRNLYNMLFLGLVFQAFSAVIAESFRISMYFSIFAIILIPKSISVIKNKSNKLIVYLSVLSILIGYIFWTNSFKGFTFYW